MSHLRCVTLCDSCVAAHKHVKIATFTWDIIKIEKFAFEPAFFKNTFFFRVFQRVGKNHEKSGNFSCNHFREKAVGKKDIAVFLVWKKLGNFQTTF